MFGAHLLKYHPLPFQGEVDVFGDGGRRVRWTVMDGHEVQVLPDGSHLCPFCPRRFTVRTHVRDHIRTHTGERPYQCPVCSYAAAQSSNLRAHVKNRHPQYWQDNVQSKDTNATTGKQPYSRRKPRPK